VLPVAWGAAGKRRDKVRLQQKTPKTERGNHKKKLNRGKTRIETGRRGGWTPMYYKTKRGWHLWRFGGFQGKLKTAAKKQKGGKMTMYAIAKQNTKGTSRGTRCNRPHAQWRVHHSLKK